MSKTDGGDQRSFLPPRPQPTGRTLVLLRRHVDVAAAKNRIENTTGMKTLDVREFGASTESMSEAMSGGAAVVLPRFNIVVLPAADGTQLRITALAGMDEVQHARPEFYMFAINDLSERYKKWVSDGLGLLAEGATFGFNSTLAMFSEPGATAMAAFADTEQFTWGLIATGAHKSAFTGAGIRVSVLDTGLDLEHPDFKGRAIVPRSFTGGDVQDVQGHGTHTAGTIAGPKISQIGRRYGVAPDVELHVVKVLNDSGSGREGDIINGMNSAIDERCAAISMSLGRPTSPGEKPDPLYEEVGSAALAEGCLIIAAAGNESARDFGYIAPVSAPANSRSILAVSAVDPKLGVAPFSCGGINPDGGEVDMSGPGVSVYSSFPRPQLSKVLQGTSMACPHVAGIAALWAESDPSLRGQKLWDALVRSARSIGPGRDFGAGLIQAPGVGAGV